MRVVFGTESLAVGVTGTDTGYFVARDWKVVSGREFSGPKCATAPASACSARRCASSSSARRSRRLDGPRRQDELPRHRPAQPKGFSGFGQDQDDIVLMPLKAFQRRIAGSRDVDNIYVSADDETPTSVLQTRMEDILRDAATFRRTATTISRCAT